MRGLCALFGAALVVLLTALQAPLVQAATGRWLSDRDPNLGFTFSYPRTLFHPIQGDGKPSFHYFVSGSDAKFLVGGWNNRAGRSPEGFKRWLIANAGGYDEVTYRPRGRSWFVLSGYRGDQIYYEKVMFSCGGSVVNIFAMVYPVAERNFFDPIVERMEDSFRPGRRCS